MRCLIVLSVVMPFAASAQTAGNPLAARASATGEPTIAGFSDDAAMAPAETAIAPAARGKNGKILSRNEIYNIGRKAEGRVGIRVGNDMSFRVEKKAGD